MFLSVINVNGGAPVDWWGVARAAISTRGSLTSQSLWLVATYFFNILTTVLLARSTWSEEIGWWLIWSLPCIPRSFHTSCMISAVKWVPRSELTLKGSPTLEKMWFINKQAVVCIIGSWVVLYPLYTMLTVAGVLPSLFGGPTMGRSFLSFAVVCSVVWICWLELATHQASFNVFRYVLLHARSVCYLLECFIGGLDTVVSCAWCIVCVCQHHPPLAMRDYELWRSEWLRDICENTCSKMQHVLERVERAELGGCV